MKLKQQKKKKEEHQPKPGCNIFQVQEREGRDPILLQLRKEYTLQSMAMFEPRPHFVQQPQYRGGGEKKT